MMVIIISFLIHINSCNIFSLLSNICYIFFHVYQIFLCWINEKLWKLHIKKLGFKKNKTRSRILVLFFYTSQSYWNKIDDNSATINFCDYQYFYFLKKPCFHKILLVHYCVMLIILASYASLVRKVVLHLMVL